MQLEITYSYKEDKYSLPQTSWTYYTPKSEDLKKAISEADKYYKRFVSSSGWGKKASLISISTLKNETTPLIIGLSLLSPLSAEAHGGRRNPNHRHNHCHTHPYQGYSHCHRHRANSNHHPTGHSHGHDHGHPHRHNHHEDDDVNIIFGLWF